MIEISKKERITGTTLICIGIIIVLIGILLTPSLPHELSYSLIFFGLMPFVFFGIIIGFLSRGGSA